MKANGKKEQQIGELLLLGKQCPIYLTRDYNFAVIVEGRRFAAASIKQLQSLATRQTNDAAFQPSRLELESLDTATRYIHGKYEDAARSVSISVSYYEEKQCYEAHVNVSAKGKQHSKEFSDASRILAEQVMEEIRQRLIGQEWRALPVKPRHGRSHYCDEWRISLSEDWHNPRQATRVTAKQILDSAQEFLTGQFEITNVSTEKAYGGDELTITLQNGQQFEIRISEK